jgi:hypothetical protein
MIKLNNLSKAMQIVKGNSNAVRASIRVFDKLESKFPRDVLKYRYDAAFVSWLKDFEPENYIQLDSDEIHRLIGKLKPGVKPGIDKLRGEHLKQLIGRRIEPSASEGEFSELLPNIINIFLT